MSSSVIPPTVVASSVEQTYLGIDTLHLRPPANTTSLHPFSALASPQRTLEHRESLLGFSSSDCSQEGSCTSPSNSSQQASPSDSFQQVHYFSSDSSRGTPCAGTVDVAKSYILDDYGYEDIRFRTPKEVFFDKEIQALLNPRLEDRGLVKRYHYELDSCELTIVFMGSPLHETTFACLARSYTNVTANNKALLPLVLYPSTPELVCSSLPHRSRKVTGNLKLPDSVIMWRSSLQSIWAVVFEVGFSETYEQLIDDAREWLLSTQIHPVNTVVIVKIDEDRATRKSDESTERIHSLIARFGDDRTRERYGIEANNDVVDYHEAVKGIQQELDVKDWVGDLRVYAEKWKLRDGEPQRYGPRVEVYPREHAHGNLSFPFTDIIPEMEYARVKDDIPQDFLVNMDNYRDLLEYDIQQLAIIRAAKFIRQEKRDDDDPDYDPDYDSV